MDIRVKAVTLRDEGVKSAREVCEMCDISERTLWRWLKRYRAGGVDGLRPEKPGPKRGSHAISGSLEERIIRLKQKHPSWGARREEASVRSAGLPDDCSPGHQEARASDSGQGKASAMQALPEKTRGFDVAGRYLPVPHKERR